MSHGPQPESSGPEGGRYSAVKLPALDGREGAGGGVGGPRSSPAGAKVSPRLPPLHTAVVGGPDPLPTERSEAWSHDSQEQPLHRGKGGAKYSSSAPAGRDVQAPCSFPSLMLAVRYVSAGARRDRSGLCVGIITVALVVGFTALLQSAIQRTPVIFLKLAEDQVGETDFTLMPSSRATVAGFAGPPAADQASLAGISLINTTEIDSLIADNPELAGAAPRWLAIGKLLQENNPLVNVSSIILIIDSKKEKEIGLGRNWEHRPLGEQEAYVSNTALQELGVTPDAGERFVLHLDFLELIGSLGGAVAGGDFDVDDPESVRNMLTDAGLDLTTPVNVDLSNAGETLGQLLGLDLGGVNLDPLGSVAVDPSGLFDALYPTLRSSLVIDQELIAVKGIDSPEGKWPPLLGNVVVLEMKYAAQLIREALDNALTLIETLGTGTAQGGSTIPGVPAGGIPIAAGGLTGFRTFVDSLNAETLPQYAMQVAVQIASPLREDVYFSGQAGMKAGLMSISNGLAANLGLGYPASLSTPLAGTLNTTFFIQLFLDQIFNVVAFMLGLLGVLVIYALVLGDVEAKTYEYGMLRALGLRHTALSALLSVQSAFFSLPGVVAGLVVASVLNIGAMLGVGALAGTTPPMELHVSAWVLGALMGILMPSFANIVPIRRALSSVLRDALDMYHKASGDVSVQMLKLAKLGLSPGQIALACSLVTIGFVTFYLLPLAFVLRNFSLFLGVLNGILVGMILGLSLVSQALQARAERIVLWCMLWGRERRLGTVVRKNLSGHRPRNRKTAYLVSIFVAFVLFAGTMFSLQSTSISNTVKMALGADVVAISPTTELPLPQEDMTVFLETARRASASGPALISGYSFMTFPMNNIRPATETRFSNLVAIPRPRATVTGVQSNFLDVTYTEFLEVTEQVPLSDAVVDRLEAAGEDPSDLTLIGDMAAGRGTLTLPIEGEGLLQPPVTVVGPKVLPLYACNETSKQYQWSWDCTRACSGGYCTEVNLVNTTTLAAQLESSYTNYVDVVMSEAQRDFSSVTTESPLRLRVKGEMEGTDTSRVYLAKARAMVQKMPGFFFSSYSQTANRAPLVMLMEDFGTVMLEVQADVTDAAAINVVGVPDEEGAQAPTPTGTGGTTAASTANGTWILSSPLWVSVTDSRYTSAGVAANSNSTLALDNNAATQLTFTTVPSAGSPVWFAWDTGACVHASGFRVRGSGTVGDVRTFNLYTSTGIGGPWTKVASGQVGSDDVGAAARQWYEFTLPSPGMPDDTASAVAGARFWKFEATDNYGWTGGVVVVDVQLKGAAAVCQAPTPVVDDDALFLPKQRLLVKMNPVMDTPDGRQRVLNGLRSTIDSDLIQVQDTATLLESTETTNLALQYVRVTVGIFFNVVAALCLILAFFASWVSFSSNVMENSRELGVLRSLGLTSRQVVRVFLYESLSVVLAAFGLGTVVGILVSVSLTLQFNLFTEMPFQFSLPVPLFLFTSVMSIAVAVVSSYLPAKRLVGMVISNVLAGKNKEQ